MKAKTTIAATGLVALGMAVGGITAATGAGDGATPSRLDDGASLVSKAKVSEAQAIAAAKTAASGDLNENDLEYAGGKLVWNIDVGDKDVKVDATTGAVLSVGKD